MGLNHLKIIQIQPELLSVIEVLSLPTLKKTHHLCQGPRIQGRIQVAFGIEGTDGFISVWKN